MLLLHCRWKPIETLPLCHCCHCHCRWKPIKSLSLPLNFHATDVPSSEYTCYWGQIINYPHKWYKYKYKDTNTRNGFVDSKYRKISSPPRLGSKISSAHKALFVQYLSSIQSTANVTSFRSYNPKLFQSLDNFYSSSIQNIALSNALNKSFFLKYLS